MGINDLITQSKEQKSENPEDATATVETKNAFTEDDLKMNWRKFAFKAKDENLKTLHAAMVDRDPVLKPDFEIHYTVANDIQLEFIETHKTELVQFLRSQLKNKAIQLILKIETIAAVKPATSKDKFQEMAKRNPNLKDLRNRFKLDFDY